MIFIEPELEAEEESNHRILHGTNLKSPQKIFLSTYIYSHNPLGDVLVTSFLALNTQFLQLLSAYYVCLCDLAEKPSRCYYMAFELLLQIKHILLAEFMSLLFLKKITWYGLHTYKTSSTNQLFICLLVLMKCTETAFHNILQIHLDLIFCS